MKTNKKKKTLRPTSGKVREALFDIMRGKIENARFLDLYAGTGAVGIEALNEGAGEVFFVEESRGNVRKIVERIKKYQDAHKTTVITKKAMSFIHWAALQELSFDIIFLDPPYHTDEIMHALAAVGPSHILAREGIVIAEHFTKNPLPDRLEGLRKVKEYHYGDTVLSFFQTTGQR